MRPGRSYLDDVVWNMGVRATWRRAEGWFDPSYESVPSPDSSSRISGDDLLFGHAVLTGDLDPPSDRFDLAKVIFETERRRCWIGPLARSGLRVVIARQRSTTPSPARRARRLLERVVARGGARRRTASTAAERRCEGQS